METPIIDSSDIVNEELFGCCPGLNYAAGYDQPDAGSQDAASDV